MRSLTKNTGVIFSLWFILLAGVTAYLPTLHNSFVNLDDNIMVTENPVVKTLNLRNIKTILTEPHAGLYHPVVLLSYAVEYHFAGLDPAVFHATNLFLHVTSCLLVFWLIYLLCGSKSTAFVSGLLFAVHPLHVESVAWISERKDMLYAVFFLSAMISYLYFRIKLSRTGYLLALLFFVLSLLSKPMAITLPAVLLLLDYLKENRLNSRDWENKIPFLFLAIVFGCVALGAHYPETALSAGKGTMFSLVPHSLNAAFNIIFYIKKFFLPTSLACAYPYSTKLYTVIPGYYYSAVPLAAAFIALAVSISKRSKTIAFGILFFLVTVAPVLQLVPVGIELPGDRYMYLPSIGLIYIVAVGLIKLYKGDNTVLRGVSVLLIAGISISLAGATIRQTKVWHDSLSLWDSAIARYPSVYFSYLNRADAWQEKGNYALAFADYETCLRLKPDCAKAYNNRGNLYARLNDTSRALNDYAVAIGIAKTYAAPYYNRAVLLARMGRTDEAAGDYLSAIERNPRDVMSYNNLAVISARRHDFHEAIKLLSSAISIDGNLFEAYRNRGCAYACLNQNYLAMKDAAALDTFGHRQDAAFIRHILKKEAADGSL